MHYTCTCTVVMKVTVIQLVQWYHPFLLLLLLPLQVLQNIGNLQSEVEAKEQFMQPMSAFLAEGVEEVKTYVSKLIDVEDSTSEGTCLSVCLSERKGESCTVVHCVIQSQTLASLQSNPCYYVCLSVCLSV